MQRLAILILSFILAAAAHAVDEKSFVRPTNDSLERQPLRTVVPYYPELARRERLEGEVQVCFHIRANGKTHGVRVRKSTNRIFEKPAAKAVRASTYAALGPGEKVSPVKSCRTFRFYLSPVAIETL